MIYHHKPHMYIYYCSAFFVFILLLIPVKYALLLTGLSFDDAGVVSGVFCFTMLPSYAFIIARKLSILIDRYKQIGPIRDDILSIQLYVSFILVPLIFVLTMYSQISPYTNYIHIDNVDKMTPKSSSILLAAGMIAVIINYMIMKYLTRTVLVPPDEYEAEND